MQTFKRPAEMAADDGNYSYPSKKRFKSTQFLDLDEDRLTHMDWKELYAVTQACRQIETLANEQFQKKYSDNQFTFCPDFRDDDDSTKLNLSPNVLRKYGKFLRTLKVYKIHGEDAENNWQVIFESCKQLKELVVDDCELKFFMPDNRLKSSQFDSLELNFCDGNDEDFARIIRCCKRLTLMYGPPLTYPELKKVYLLAWNGHLDSSMCEFFRLNPQVEEIYVSGSNLDNLSRFVGNCTEIESRLTALSIHKVDCQGIAVLHRLNNLKHLDLGRYPCDHAFFANFVPAAINKLAETNALESLCIRYKMDIDSCVAICKLSNLKTLKLVKLDINVDFLVKFMRDMNLKNFQVIHCDNVKYDDIARAITLSHKLEILKFTASKNKPLDERNFSQLAVARRQSDANFPLEFAQIERQFDRMLVEVQTIAANADVIKLKRIKTKRRDESWDDRLCYNSTKDDIYYDRDD